MTARPLASDPDQKERGRRTTAERVKHDATRDPEFFEWAISKERPRMAVEQGIYKVEWDNPAYTMLEFDYLTHSRSSGDVHAEITVTVDAPTKGHYQKTRLNLLADRSVSSLAGSLSKRLPELKIPWDQRINDAVQWVLHQYRAGDPGVYLDEISTEDQEVKPPFPLLAADGPTIIFGDGEATKSYLALATALSLGTGLEIIAGLPPDRAMKVGYLDWEWKASRHARRLHAMWKPIDGDLPRGRIRYIKCSKPITEERDRLRREIRDHGLEALIVDSAGYACNGAPEEAEVALAFFRTIEQLGLPVLILAHVNRVDAKNGADKPFGCYDDQTEVLTARGWLSHDQVQLTDEVATFDLTTETLRWDRPLRINAYDYDGDMVAIRGGSADMLVTPNHGMVVQPGYAFDAAIPGRNPRRWHIRQAEDLTRAPWRIPYATAFEERSVTEEVSADFARFLGWWVSEGSLDKLAPVITQAEGPLAERMRETVAALGYEANSWVGKTHEHEVPVMQLRLRKASVLGAWLKRESGHHCWDKRLPSVVWQWNAERRGDLFTALMDGDGHWNTDTRGVYTSTSKELADDVQRLAISLGWSARVRRLPERPDPQRPIYNVYVGRRSSLTIRAERNISRVPYQGKVYCLTVPSGAYVTRRNGYMGIAGNSSFWHNSARATWYIKRDEQDSIDGHVSVALFERKNNESSAKRTLGLQWHFDEEHGTTAGLSKHAIAESASLSSMLSTGKRIVLLLKAGPMTVHQIAEELDAGVDAVRKAVHRGDAFVKVPGGAGMPDRWALAAHE